MKIILNEKDVEKIVIEYMKEQKHVRNKRVGRCLQGMVSIFMLKIWIDILCDVSNGDFDMFKK